MVSFPYPREGDVGVAEPQTGGGGGEGALYGWSPTGPFVEGDAPSFVGGRGRASSPQPFLWMGAANLLWMGAPIHKRFIHSTAGGAARVPPEVGPSPNITHECPRGAKIQRWPGLGHLCIFRDFGGWSLATNTLPPFSPDRYERPRPRSPARGMGSAPPW